MNLTFCKYGHTQSKLFKYIENFTMIKQVTSLKIESQQISNRNFTKLK